MLFRRNKNKTALAAIRFDKPQVAREGTEQDRSEYGSLAPGTSGGQGVGGAEPLP